MNQNGPIVKNSLALVLSGGGARGAYEAGVIHYLRTMLPPSLRHRSFSVHCGSSSGAINVCFMASTADDLKYQGDRMIELWKETRPENIYLRNTKALSHFLFHTAAGLFRNLTRVDFLRERHGEARHFQSLFDTTPFHQHLRKIIRWEKIHDNVRKGLLQATSVVATRMRTGKPELFIQKGGSYDYRGEYEVHSVDLGPEHVMASAAIPLVFSNIPIGENYYLDGSIRLNTPLSPPIQLGAKRILVVSLHPHDAPDPTPHDCSESQCPPSLGEHLGKLLNAFFLDRLKYDIEQLERINRLIDVSARVYGPDYLHRVNTALGPQHHFQKIDYLKISPSVPISSVFSEWFEHGKTEGIRLSFMERLLMRLLDVDPSVNMDLLSYLTFDRNYLTRVIDLGFEDARRQHDQLCAFFLAAREERCPYNDD